MKATGVVRKIDHLGRIVIPKEIRKNLKIRDGDDLEIYVEDDAILLKKFSSLSRLDEYAGNFSEVISVFLHKNLIITDLSRIIACNREIKEQFAFRELSSDYLTLLQKREVYITSEKAHISLLEGQSFSTYYMLLPIVVQGELLGSLLLFSEEKISDNDKVLLRFILKLLEKNLED